MPKEEESFIDKITTSEKLMVIFFSP